MSEGAFGTLQARPAPWRAQEARAQQQALAAAGYRGWGAQFLQRAIEANRFLMAIAGVQRSAITTGDILKLKFNTLASLVQAAEIVLQGSSAKQAINPVTPVTAGVATVRTFGVRAIGAIIHFSDSFQAGDYREVPFAVSGTGVTAYTATVTPCFASYDLIVLFISNNAGEATLVGPTDGTITVAADAARPGSFISIQTLTLRDIM